MPNGIQKLTNGLICCFSIQAWKDWKAFTAACMSLSKVARPLQTPKAQLNLIPVSNRFLAFNPHPSFSSFVHILTTLSEKKITWKRLLSGVKLWSGIFVWSLSDRLPYHIHTTSTILSKVADGFSWFPYIDRLPSTTLSPSDVILLATLVPLGTRRLLSSRDQATASWNT